MTESMHVTIHEEEAEEEEVFLEEGETVPLESEVNALEPKEENSEQDQ